jgi:hypothetical protein
MRTMVATAVVKIAQGRRAKAPPECYGYRSIAVVVVVVVAVAFARLIRSNSSASVLWVLDRLSFPHVLDWLPPPLSDDLFVHDILEFCGIGAWLEQVHGTDVVTDGSRC